ARAETDPFHPSIIGWICTGVRSRGAHGPAIGARSLQRADAILDAAQTRVNSGRDVREAHELHGGAPLVEAVPDPQVDARHAPDVRQRGNAVVVRLEKSHRVPAGSESSSAAHRRAMVWARARPSAVSEKTPRAAR